MVCGYCYRASFLIMSNCDSVCIYRTVIKLVVGTCTTLEKSQLIDMQNMIISWPLAVQQSVIRSKRSLVSQISNSVSNSVSNFWPFSDWFPCEAIEDWFLAKFTAFIEHVFVVCNNHIYVGFIKIQVPCDRLSLQEKFDQSMNNLYLSNSNYIW